MVEIKIDSPAFSDSTPKVIKCNSISYALKKSIDKTPNANANSIVEVQTNSFENPVIQISGLKLTDSVGTLTLKNIQELIKHNYDGVNKTTLSITYASYDQTSERNLTSLADLSTTSIPVVLSSHNLTISASDSKDAHLPIGTLSFTETA